MRSLPCVVIALAMMCLCSVTEAAGTILVFRHVNGTYNGNLMPVGSGLFTYAEDGTQLQQVTPLQANTWYDPSGVTFGGPPGLWMTRNFSPDGQSVMYFTGQTTDPSAGGPSSGKYYVQNLRTGATQALFEGSNDIAPPGYGYLAWSPDGSNVIAYTNSNNGAAVSPACVYLMNPDGSGKHSLWCAPAQISTPNGAGPTQAVEALRWAGNGRKLLAFVAYQPPGQTSGLGAVAAYLVDVKAGTASEVTANIPYGAGDVSYDGMKVLYQQWGGSECGSQDPNAAGVSLCVKDMCTGKVTSLLPPNSWNSWGLNGYWWSPYWDDALLLSPDGSQAAFLMKTSGGFEADLYVINTDGTNLRQLTAHGPIPDAIYTNWMPTAWSPDGTQILVNRTTEPNFSSTDQTWPSEVHIITVSNAKDTLVTSNGHAVDWLKN